MGKRGPLAGTTKRGAPTGIRFDPALKARLDQAKDASGRSFSEEVSARLEASFGSIQFNDPATEALAARIAIALDIVREQTGHSWFEDSWSFDRATEAIQTILTGVTPTGPAVIPDDAPVLRALRATGLEDLVGQAREQLANSNLGVLAGTAALALGDAAADGEVSPHLDHLKLFSERVQERQRELGSVGEESALEELKKAAGKSGAGVRL